MSTFIVVISWPDDPDRGSEHFGPFSSEEERNFWISDCQQAAGFGWKLLQGASYLLTTLDRPFDPFDLMNDGERSLKDGS